MSRNTIIFNSRRSAITALLCCITFIFSCSSGDDIVSGDPDPENPGNPSGQNMGEIDGGFAVGQGFTNASYGSLVFDIQYFDNGFLVSSKYGSSYKGTPVGQICKINLDGSLDTSFNTMASFEQDFGDVTRMLILSDGKIAVVGTFTTTTGTSGIAVLNTNGTLDNSFNVNGAGISGNGLFALAEDGDGRIFAGGYYSSFNGVYNPKNILCFNRNGSINTGFQIPGNGFNAEVDDLIIRNNKLYVAGRFSTYGSTATQYLAQLTLDGAIDQTYSGLADDGSFVHGAYAIGFQSSGKLVVGGAFITDSGTSSLARYNDNGTLDTSFAYDDDLSDGWSTFRLQQLAILDNDAISVGGNFYYGSYAGMAILDSNGEPHQNFTYDSPFLGTVRAIAVTPQKKIAVGGDFTSYDNAETPGIVLIKGNSN